MTGERTGARPYSGAVDACCAEYASGSAGATDPPLGQVRTPPEVTTRDY
ncbi:hypothetical protein [Halomicrobium salinisoli]|nr:hypothetical protein [Halomicrobium salinisoli]